MHGLNPRISALLACVASAILLASGCLDPYRGNPNWHEATCPYCRWHGYWPVAGLREHSGRAECPQCKKVFQAYSTSPSPPRQRPPSPQRQSVAARAAAALDAEMRQNYGRFYQRCGFAEDLTFAQITLDEVVWYRMRDADKQKFIENTFYHTRQAIGQAGASGQPYFHLVSTDGKVMARGVIINGQRMPNLVEPEYWASESLRRALPPGR